MQYLDASNQINCYWKKYGFNGNQISIDELECSQIDGYYTYEYDWLCWFISDVFGFYAADTDYYAMNDPIDTVTRIICDMLCMEDITYFDCIVCKVAIMITTKCAYLKEDYDDYYVLSIPPQSIPLDEINWSYHETFRTTIRLGFFFGYNGDINEAQAQRQLINLSKHTKINSSITKCKGPVCSINCFRHVCINKKHFKNEIVDSFIKFDNNIKFISIPIVIQRLIAKYLYLS